MSWASTLARIGSAFLLAFSLSGCASDPEPSTSSNKRCEALLTTLNDAQLESGLAPDLATHADSDGGATVTDAESKEIQQVSQRETAAREAATAAGCLEQT